MGGDRQMDIFGAKNNDINNIGALWGYGEADELRMAEADMLAGHPEELAEISFDMMGLDLDQNKGVLKWMDFNPSILLLF